MVICQCRSSIEAWDGKGRSRTVCKDVWDKSSSRVSFSRHCDEERRCSQSHRRWRRRRWQCRNGRNRCSAGWSEKAKWCKRERWHQFALISWWTVTAYVYNTVYSELTACNPTLTRWLQHRYKQSRLCVTEQWPLQPHAYSSQVDYIA